MWTCKPMPKGFRTVTAEQAAKSVEYLRTAGQRGRPSMASVALPQTNSHTHTINIRKPPCRLVHSSVMGTSSHKQGVFRRRSASTSHRQAGSNNKVKRCGRAKKCIEEPPTANKQRQAASNPLAPRQTAYRRSTVAYAPI